MVKVPYKSNSQLPRYPFVMTAIGENRTGKSVTMRKFAIKWRMSREKEKFKIISHDPQKRFDDITDFKIDVNDPEVFIKLSRTKNKLFIFDDVRLLHKQSKSMPGFDDMFYNRAKNNVDMMFIYHNPALVLNTCAYFTTHWLIFPTNEQDGGFQKKIPSYNLCKAALISINEYVKDFDRTSFYPNFPYVIVEKETGRINAINYQNKTNGFRK